MGQKPVNQRRQVETRQAIWNVIRETGTFTVPQLKEQTVLGIHTIRAYIQALTAAGYIKNLGEQEAPPGHKPQSPIIRQPQAYQLVKNTGVEAPRVRKDGTKITMGENQERMWRVMRILREFSAMDVVMTTGTENSTITLLTARSYIQQLHKAGYLVIVQAGRPGHKADTGTLARYRLLPGKNTGPKHPMVQRGKQVYDQNLKKVIWAREEKQ